MDPAEVAARRDLRETHLVFSIDPKGCEDVDDALSVRSLAGGTVLEMGVHIADVTHFVKEGSLTDLEAFSRFGAFGVETHENRTKKQRMSQNCCVIWSIETVSVSPHICPCISLTKG